MSSTNYIATVKDVREVSLVTAADLAFWRERLEPTGLFPFHQDGKARLTFSATDFRFQGKQTNEFTVSVAVSMQADGCSLDGLYLLYAFNSSRFFAWIERTLFKTPYYPGQIQLAHQVPARLAVGDGRGPLIQAQMNTAVLPARSQDELWQGAIHLPSYDHEKRLSKSGLLFYARLGGFTVVYPYLASQSSFILSARPEYPFVQWLLDSKVVLCEWHIRSQAVHARSKTTQINFRAG